MFRRAILGVGRVFALNCIALLLAASSVHGDGSILFNGSTSKLQHDTANVLNGSGDITICVWVNASGFDASGNSNLIRFDDLGTGLIFRHAGSAGTLSWIAGFAGGNGEWTFPVQDGTWHAVAITHAKSVWTAVPTV